MLNNKRDTIVSLLQARAERHPDRNYVTYLVDGEKKEDFLSYGELDHSARQIANWLTQQGLNRGDRVILMLPNGNEFMELFFGCLYAGVIAVPQPQQLRAYLKTFVPTLASCQPKMLIGTVSLVEYLRGKLPSELRKPFAELNIFSDVEVLSEKDAEAKIIRSQLADIAYLQYTSGSTGNPKGVMISHNNIVSNMEQARIFGNWEEGRGTALWLPLFHDFGLAAGMLGALYNGGFVVLMSPAHFMVKPLRWLAAMSKYGCAYSYSPPFGFDLCVKQISAEERKNLDLSKAVSMVYGAEPVHYEAAKRFNETFAECGLKPTVVRPGFGMAETVIMFSESDGVSAIRVDRNELEKNGKLKIVDESLPEERRKYLVSLGPSMNGHEIVIRDENNNALPEGEAGEILIQGPSVAEGYFNNPVETQKTFHISIQGKKGLFMSTGDRGVLWKKNLYFTGRIKDIIIIRGRNYFPHDIEFAVPQGKEIRTGCVIAFASSKNEEGDKLVLAMEVQAELLMDKDMFHKYILPSIDNKIVSTIGKRFGIYPDTRLYLKPGSMVKTSSGKIKHAENIRKIECPDYGGIIACLPTISDEEKEIVDLRENLIEIFERITRISPKMDAPILNQINDQQIFNVLIERIQEKYPVPGLDLTDIIDSTTTLNEIFTWLDEQLGSAMIAI